MQTKREKILERKRQQEKNQATDPWEKVTSYVKNDELIPVVSNSFCIEQIFEQIFPEEGGISTYDQLTDLWAEELRYPMEDTQDLARVAQYYQVNIKLGQKQIPSYYESLKSNLLVEDQTEPVYQKITRGLDAQLQETKGTKRETLLSEIAVQLDYPRVMETQDDPLHLLADLPLKVFITTSHHDFLERALIAAGKKPKTQICLWSEKIDVRPEHKPDADFNPTREEPLIFHIFGREDYPRSLVLSESDYMEFLISVAQDTNTIHPIIPHKLRMGLSTSQLLLLGYRLQDWDFRVLFQIIQKFKSDNRGLIVQIEPSENPDTTESLKTYLEEYLNFTNFDIEWEKNRVSSYINELWNAWKKSQNT